MDIMFHLLIVATVSVIVALIVPESASARPVLWWTHTITLIISTVASFSSIAMMVVLLINFEKTYRDVSGIFLLTIAIAIVGSIMFVKPVSSAWRKRLAARKSFLESQVT
jgi:hypothetical protein